MIGIMHLIALVAGIVVLLLIRKRYPGISSKELAIIIFLYIILVFLFTEPVVNFFKTMMS
ncbi:MAG: hypothetical protein ABFD62_00700 [Syntrophaceae bacterium]